MIDPSPAEAAQELLETTAAFMETLVFDKLEKARLAKYEQALAITRMEDVPVGVRKEHALTSDKVQAAIQEANAAEARLIGTDAERDAAKSRISLYQSMVKDRM